MAKVPSSWKFKVYPYSSQRPTLEEMKDAPSGVFVESELGLSTEIVAVDEDGLVCTRSGSFYKLSPETRQADDGWVGAFRTKYGLSFSEYSAKGFFAEAVKPSPAPAPEPVITNCMINPGWGGHVVSAQFGDDEWKELFSFFPDELSFSRGEFLGLTRREAFDLHTRKDVAYLRS